MKIAVIAGTPVDTQMGIDYLHQRDAGLETVFLPCASDPRACHLFQVKSPEEKTATMRELYRSAIDIGIRYFFVYCNSLSSAVDFDTLSESMGVKTVTPMRAYEKLALDYNILGLLAANNQSTKGIEDRFTAVNPSGYVIGIGNLRLTEAVERMTPPAEIVSNFRLRSACDFFEASGCEAVVLACTHFPYFKEELSQFTGLPILDPADIMFEELLANINETSCNL